MANQTVSKKGGVSKKASLGFRYSFFLYGVGCIRVYIMNDTESSYIAIEGLCLHKGVLTTRCDIITLRNFQELLIVDK